MVGSNISTIISTFKFVGLIIPQGIKYANMTSEVQPETGSAFRLRVRCGEFNKPTAGCVPGNLQGNVVVLPKADAHDFLRYCLNNPKPCPLVGLSKPGQRSLPNLGEDIDISRDIPKYHLFVDGELVDTCESVQHLWQDNFVTFVLGCSFTFEQALIAHGYSVRHIELKKNVSMYRTNYSSYAFGRFSGPMVVTMRPVKKKDIDDVFAICMHYSHAHGAPLFFGDPKKIGIEDLSRPDYGDAIEVQDDEVPMFWACGVTTQVAISNAKPSICITHAPGCMLVTDIKGNTYPKVAECAMEFFRKG